MAQTLTRTSSYFASQAGQVPPTEAVRDKLRLRGRWSCGQKDRTGQRLESCRTCGGAVKLTDTRYYNRPDYREGGRRVRKNEGSYGKKKDAITAHVAAAQARTQGTWIEPSKQSLGEFLLKEWLPAIEPTIRPSTFASYRRNIERHVLPVLRTIPLSKLMPAQLNGLYAGLTKGRRPLAAKTIRYIHTIIHRALKDAQRWGKLAQNAATLADPPRPMAPDSMTVWTPEQVRQFLDQVLTHRLYPLYVLGLTTGMRRGELVGLRWSDVDLEKGYLSVRQTAVSIGYRVAFSEPKTARSRRTMTIDPATISVLRQLRRRQREERLAWGPAWTDCGLVFTKEDGSACIRSWSRMPSKGP